MRVIPTDVLIMLLMIVSMSQLEVVPDEIPMLMVVSLDGFRPDYLFMENSPMKELKKISGKGVLCPSGMIPCFSTKTFPNHYSIATGLFEESHGIIDNEMYNANKNPVHFKFTSNAPDWWDNGLSMPVWILNEKKGHSSGVIMWPGGTEKINNISATYRVPFNVSVSLRSRIDSAFSFMTSKSNPANCIFLYFHQPDSTSHHFGPFSNEIKQSLKEIDEAIGYLLEKIESFELENRLNLIVLSDHGMDVVPKSNLIVISDIIPSSICDVYGAGPIVGVVPHQGKFEEVFSYLQQKSMIYNFTVMEKENLSDSLHFKNNENVPEILLLTEPGYEIIHQKDTSPAPFRGAHGYNNKLVSMRALFLAKGPAFKENIAVEPFLNVHLYSLMCHILKLEPHPNNGSLDAISYILASYSIAKSRRKFHDIALIVSSVILVLLTFTGCIAAFMCKKSKSKEYHPLATQFDLSEDITLYEREAEDST